MKVIKEGQIPTRRITCRECGSVLEYTNSDLTEVYDYRQQATYITAYSYDTKYELTCPICKAHIEAQRIIPQIHITEEQFSKLPKDIQELFQEKDGE